METNEIEQYVKERDEALMSLDNGKIKAFFAKFNGSGEPPRDDVFWVAVHKAITGASTLPIEFRRKSKVWLEERGFKSFDDGDL